MLNLTSSQIEHLVKDYHIYLPSSGRINVAGLNKKSLGKVARGLNSVAGREGETERLWSE